MWGGADHRGQLGVDQLLRPLLEQPAEQLPAVPVVQARRQVGNPGIIVMGARYRWGSMVTVWRAAPERSRKVTAMASVEASMVTSPKNWRPADGGTPATSAHFS